MGLRVYLSPERRLPPHGPYWGCPGIYEHTYCQELAELTAEALARHGFLVRVAEQDQTIYQRVPDAEGWGAQLYLPLHTNASTDGKTEGKARGALVLTRDDTESRRLSELVFAELNALSPSTRGVRLESSFYEVRMPKAPVAYVEAAFHDNGEDARYLTARKAEIAEALCRAVCSWAGASAETPERTALREISALAQQIQQHAQSTLGE